jgi:hypothetical protein
MRRTTGSTFLGSNLMQSAGRFTLVYRCSKICARLSKSLTMTHHSEGLFAGRAIAASLFGMGGSGRRGGVFGCQIAP